MGKAGAIQSSARFVSEPFGRLRMRTRGAENQMGLLNAIHELSSVNRKRVKMPGENGSAFCDRNGKRLGALDEEPACFETRSVERSSA